jgi:hypothetical protein
MSDADDRSETRRVPVEVHDPKLSHRANELLTQETREALGRDEGELPVDRADSAGRTHPRSEGVMGAIWERRMLVGVTLAVAVVVAAVLALTTGSWWWLPLAVIVHAVATFLVTAVVIRSTTAVEAPDPSVAVALEREGVRDPEVELTEQVRSFASDEDGAPGSDVLTPGDNRRRTQPEESPGGSTAEQQTAVTPDSQGSAPAGAGTPKREQRDQGDD